MKDQFGFPRRSETLAQGVQLGGAWRVFWSAPRKVLTSARTSPGGPFPGRYFRDPNTYTGTGAGVATVNSNHGMLTPMIRYQFWVTTGTNATTFQVALSGDLTTATTLQTVTPTTAVGMGWGYLYLLNKVTLESVNFQVTDNAAPVAAPTVTSITYGSQDLWFTVNSTAVAATISGVLVEYLEVNP